MMDQRREHVRRLLRINAKLVSESNGRSWPAQVIDIARMGVGFVTDEIMDPERRYRFSFSFPDSGVRDEVVVELVYSRVLGSAGRFRNGARFVAMSPGCAERIVDYVTSAFA